MAISFSCKVNDPHTESLLLFLEDLLGDNEEHKLEVLSCAKQWLQLDTPAVFNRGDARRSLSLRVVADGPSQDVLEPSQSLSLHL